jgi:transposase
MAKDALGRRVRRRFSEEFKEGAVRLVLDEGKTIGAVARELDLTASALSLWVQHARADRTKGKSGLMKEEREELTRLRKEIRELRIERDLLKNLSRAGAAPLVCQKLRDVRSRPRGCGRLLFGDITNPLKNMVRGWPAHVSVVTPSGDPV